MRSTCPEPKHVPLPRAPSLQENPQPPPPTNSPPNLLNSPHIFQVMSPQSFLWILLFVLLHSTSAPNGAYELDGGSSCRLELIQHSLHRCRSFLRRGPQRAPLLPMTAGASDNAGAPEECCAQLRQVREGCRCRGIREMVREVKWEEGFRGRECRGRCGEMLMRGKLLPAMCSVEPHRCEMGQGVGYDDDE